MSIAQDNVALAAHRRETWTEQHINAELSNLDARLREFRGTPGAYEWLERVAERIEALEATRP